MGDNGNGFEVVCDFKVDDGQLDGMSNEMAFCLGVEFGRVRSMAIAGESFNLRIFAENTDRISSMLHAEDRDFAITMDHDDRPSLQVF